MEQKRKKIAVQKTNPPSIEGGEGQDSLVNDSEELLSNISKLIEQAGQKLKEKKKPLKGGKEGDYCRC